MRVIPPVTVTDSILTSSTIAEPSAGETVWAAYTSTIGDQRIVLATHRVYEAVAATTDDPVTGAAKSVPTWVDIGPTNKYAMFDTVVGTQSNATAPLEVELTPAQIINTIAGFNIDGAITVQVVVNSIAEGEVYNTTIEMLDNTAVVDFYEYFFSPIINVTEFLLTDLPAYSDQTITVTIDGDADIDAGVLVMGRQTIIGTALYGTNWQALDYSRKERDEFGNFIIVSRSTADRFEYDVAIEKRLFGYTKGLLKGLSTTPCVWAGTDDTGDGTVVYGYYVDTSINLSSPSIIDATITVEGLI